MTLLVDDRIVETSTTAGAGPLTLAGAVVGYITAAAAGAVNGTTAYYSIEDVDADGVPTGPWETGLGTWGTGAIWTRTTVHKSSNAGAAVNFASGGTRRITLGLTAALFATKQDVLVSGTNIKTINGASVLGSGDLTVSGGSKTYGVFTPMTSQPPASGYAILDTRNSIAMLNYDAAVEWSSFWVGVMPEAASLGFGLIVKIHWLAISATSGAVKWGASFERMNTDEDADSYDAETTGTSTTSGTSGIETVTSITCTTIDFIAAGDMYRIKINRKAADAADTMTGYAQIVAVEVRSAA